MANPKLSIIGGLQTLRLCEVTEMTSSNQIVWVQCCGTRTNRRLLSYIVTSTFSASKPCQSPRATLRGYDSGNRQNGIKLRQNNTPARFYSSRIPTRRPHILEEDGSALYHTSRPFPFSHRGFIRRSFSMGPNTFGSSASFSGLRQASTMPAAPPLHRAFVALGSNMGDRVSMVEMACKKMEERGIKVKRTSALFETAPMYVVDQEPFINGVCEVAANLSSLELLDTLQSIEVEMGRRKTIDKGPRVIDLDILLYDNEIISHERLNIPHKLMLEREFVLRPLCQLIPHEIAPLAEKGWSYQTYLDALPASSSSPAAVTPISQTLLPIVPSDPQRHTHVMAVLNVTPDSFSDGGTHTPAEHATLTSSVRDFVKAGATIIDVGGESTRPDSEPVTAEQELSRVLPAIRHLRSLPESSQFAISVDTYRAKVAEEAVNAGADIINDVSAGTMDPDMLHTMARLGTTVVLMHMRGTPQTMAKLTDYPNGVINGVGNELAERIRAVEDAGVRRWRIIADPGIGFAKKQKQNLALLRNSHYLREFEGLTYLPWLVGTSRKGFVGRITGVQKASERGWGTAAAVTAAIGGGADIVRVHDVKEMAQVTRMADAIYRQDTDF